MKTVLSAPMEKRFWIWASVRIIIVICLIVGAFLLGVRMGFGKFTESINGYNSTPWRYEHMYYKRHDPMPDLSNYCLRYIEQILSQTGGTHTGSTN